MATLLPAELLSEVVPHPRTDWGGSCRVCDGDHLLLAGPVKRDLDNVLYLKPLRRDPDGVCISCLLG